MLSKLFFKIISWFDMRSESEKREDERILENIRNAPKSMRVVGRGLVVVDPKEIVESEQYQAAVKRAAELVDKLNKQNY